MIDKRLLQASQVPVTRRLRGWLLQKRPVGTGLRTLLGAGALCTVMAMCLVGFSHASEKSQPSANSRDRSAAVARVQVALATLQRVPGVLRDSFQATASLSSKEVCQIAQGMVKAPSMESIDRIAQYLSKDVHGWSDLMITRLLKSEPAAVKGKDKEDLREDFLHKWENDRVKVQKWLQGCGVVVSTLIGRARGKIERDSSEVFEDIVAVITKGVRSKDPDAIVAAEALAQAEENLKILLK
jgi:hypothetical protein